MADKPNLELIQKLEGEKAELLHALREIVRIEEDRVREETRLFDEAHELSDSWVKEAKELIRRLERWMGSDERGKDQYTEQFVLVYGRRYRKPHPIPFNGETFKQMEAISLELFEKLHNWCSAFSKVEGYQRDERFTHAMPQALLELLEKNDDGASIVAAQTFLEAHSFKVMDD